MAQENVTSLPTKAATPAPSATAQGSEKPAQEKSTSAAPAKKAAPKKAAPKKAVKKAAPKKVAAQVKKTAAKNTATAKKVAKTMKKSADKTKSAVKKAASKTVKAAAENQKAAASAFKPSNTNSMMEKMMFQGQPQFEKLAQDASAQSREHIEAVIKSTTIFAKGFEDIMRMSMSMAQEAAERQGKFMKEVLSSKTLNEFTEVQNKVAQTNFDEFMSGATKITEMSVKLMTDAAEPMNAQMNKGIKKATQKMAA